MAGARKSLKELGRTMVTTGPGHERFQGKIPPHFFRTLHHKNRKAISWAVYIKHQHVTITN